MIDASLSVVKWRASSIIPLAIRKAFNTVPHSIPAKKPGRKLAGWVNHKAIEKLDGLLGPKAKSVVQNLPAVSCKGCPSPVSQVGH